MNDTGQLDIRPADDGAVIAVKVVAGSCRHEIVGVLGNALKIATACAAQKGRANAAAAAMLAGALGVDGRNVRLIRGRASPRKDILIVGLSPRQVRERLQELC
jgi:uncharacterized protein (TIGR00251 family)